jgi:hypothetical protein
MRPAAPLSILVLLASVVGTHADGIQAGKAAVDGAVVDDHGAAVANALVMVAPADPHILFTEEATARSDARGFYRVAHIDPRAASA